MLSRSLNAPLSQAGVAAVIWQYSSNTVDSVSMIALAECRKFSSWCAATRLAHGGIWSFGVFILDDALLQQGDLRLLGLQQHVFVELVGGCLVLNDLFGDIPSGDVD